MPFSPAFAAYFEALMAHANNSTTPATGAITVPPTPTDPHERVFFERFCRPLQGALLTYAASVTPPPAPVYGPEAYPNWSGSAP